MLTDAQIAKRLLSLGSSDMAAVLGCQPSYAATASDMAAEKKGLFTRPRIDDKTAIKMGNAAEPVLLDFAEMELGPLNRDVLAELPEYHLASRADAIVRATGEPVEAKSSGLAGFVIGNWGAAHTDAIPEWVIVQCHVHMACHGGDVCHVPAMLGGRGKFLYRVERSSALVGRICVAAKTFWERYVEGNEDPPDSLLSLDVAKLIRRVPKSVATVADSLIADCIQAREDYAAAKKRKDNTARALLGDMGTAEAAISETGALAVTYYPQSRDSIDAKGLRAAHPEIAEQFTRTSTFPVLRPRPKGLPQ